MGYHPYHSSIYLDMLEAQMISIRTRKTKAEKILEREKNDQISPKGIIELGYIHFEIDLLDEQLTALEKEYNRIEQEMK